VVKQNQMQVCCLNTERRVKRHDSLSRTLIAIVLLTVILPHARAQDLYVGSNNSGQSTNFLSGTNSYINTYVGYASNSSNNSLTIGNTNTLLTNSGDVYLGDSGPSNSMVISNGGTVSDSNGCIGYSNSTTGNSAIFRDSGSLWSNAGDMIVGIDGSGNSLVISNGGQVAQRERYYTNVFAVFRPPWKPVTKAAPVAPVAPTVATPAVAPAPTPTNPKPVAKPAVTPAAKPVAPVAKKPVAPKTAPKAE